MTQTSSLPHWPFMDGRGMRELAITQLVVGDPRALVLGRPAALRPIPCEHAGRRMNLANCVVALFCTAYRPRSWQVLATGGVIAWLVAALLALAVLQKPLEPSGGLPVSPAATIAPAVRLIPGSYVAAPAATAPVLRAEFPNAEVPLPQAPPSLPFSPPTGAQALPTPVLPLFGKAPALPAKEGPRIPQRRPAAQTRTNPEQLQGPAVVLDEEGARAEVATARAAATSSAPIVPVRQSAALAASTSDLRSRPAPEAGSGLIAITPDSTLAVFTNPRTGLPQQFHIGEPLPGGDTIRSIDGQHGKVFTSAREYSLD